MIVEAVSRLGWSEVATASNTPPTTRASPLHLSRRADPGASSAITAPSEGQPNPRFGTVVLQCIPSLRSKVRIMISGWHEPPAGHGDNVVAIARAGRRPRTTGYPETHRCSTTGRCDGCNRSAGRTAAPDRLEGTERKPSGVQQVPLLMAERCRLAGSSLP